MIDPQKKSRSAGGIVVNEANEVVMVRRAGATHWLFPKGHLDAGEDDETAARREIMEEAGATHLTLLGDLGEYERPRMRKDGTDRDGVLKCIKMFLFRTPQDTKLTPTMEMEEARFVPLTQAADELGNAQDRAWFLSVLPRIQELLK